MLEEPTYRGGNFHSTWGESVPGKEGNVTLLGQ